MSDEISSDSLANANESIETETETFDYGDHICEAEEFSKIYPTPDQVLITPEAIFVYTKNHDRLLKGKFMGIEDGRIYVAVSKEELKSSPVARGPCLIHYIYHKKCGGCGVLLCPGNCTCFD